MVSEKIFFSVPIISLCELMTPGAWPVRTPGAWFCRIYVGDYLTLLYTKSVSSKPHDFREETFLKVL